ncbi:MAG: hypothetical protein A2561_02310 [Candidatus Staskawiczbacteria bacterium RIFOXYD1_FULL_32_13]|uniref:Uncharacterized protein n=1 Tax=Candidatus Staskawiczbacteria bacterium RIFOXYD1_FULL_32_13 TaxID=1802234 RepID=A0A1G2JND3_9BACT|nr:MAG: hypothetical protein A2561_02310 [Candidatus Staskawiczbacteria bacterium RIFOXYD1_FULL_32_13]
MSEATKKVVVAEVVLKNFSPCGPKVPVTILIEKDASDCETGYPTATARFVDMDVVGMEEVLYKLRPAIKAIAEAQYWMSY